LRARPAGRVARSASHLLRLDPRATAACHGLGRRLGCTLSMTVLAAFKGLLAGLSGQRDILVRTPVANRRRAEVEPLIGFFPNALLLRTDLTGDPSFAELAGRVRETVLGAYAHQDVPFDVVTGALLPELGLPADLARVTFNFYGTSSPAPALGGLELEPAEIEPGLTDSDLVLVLQEGAEGLACRFNYRQDLFAPAVIRDLAEGLRLLLDRVAADPEERLSRLAPETVETGRTGR
jgi:non-ribosomal peptide synthetase component F